MTHVLKLADDAIRSVLMGNPSLAQMVGMRVYALQAPPGTPLPYVVFQAIGGGWTNTSPRDDVNPVYQVIGWSTDLVEAYKLAEQIHLSLHRQTLSIPGWSNYRIVADRWLSRTDWNQGQQYYGIGATYQIQADKAG